MTTGFKKVFFDSSPFIYLVENHLKYYFPVSQYLSRHTENNAILITSVITISEILVKPRRENDLALIADFKQTLKTLNFAIAEIDFKIAELSATLRANYSFLKGLDALQMATAIDQDCDEFLTNDKKLTEVREIQVQLIDKLTEK